jgi:predicted membrane metal-binding protein
VILRGLAGKLIAGVLLGACWAALLAYSALNDALPLADEDREIAVNSVVASLPNGFDGGVRFQFDVAHVDTPGATVQANIILGCDSRNKPRASASHALRLGAVRNGPCPKGAEHHIGTGGY